MFAVLLLMVLSFFGYTFCQSYDYLDRNQIKAMVSADGTLFNTYENGNYKPCFEVPKGLGINSIFYAGLFIGGFDENSLLRVSGYYFSVKDFVFGPVASKYTGADYINKYNRVWRVNLSDLEYHYFHYNDIGYEMPEVIQNWPAHGNTENGEASDLAPYYDVNGNGYYDPQNGDFPMIRGDQAIYFIVNDAGGQQATGGLKTGIEVHGMVYCFNPSIGSVLQQTVFVNYRLINRSNHNYNNFYSGMMCDFDLGNPLNDLVGSDSVLNMVYVYNSVSIDSVGASSYSVGYSNSPAQGAMLLNHPASSIYGTVGMLNTDEDYYSTLLFPEVMINPVGNYPTNFLFSGFPEEGEGWYLTDTDTLNMIYDPRMFLSSGPFNIGAGSQMCLDYAFPFAVDYGGSNMESLAFLRNKAEALQNWFNYQDFDCYGSSLGVVPFKMEKEIVSVFPNPSDGMIHIGFLSDFSGTATIEVYSTDGKIVQKFETVQLENVVNIEQPGLYLIVVKSGNKQSVKRVSVL
jgi:hypothetical protein